MGGAQIIGYFFAKKPEWDLLRSPMARQHLQCAMQLIQPAFSQLDVLPTSICAWGAPIRLSSFVFGLVQRIPVLKMQSAYPGTVGYPPGSGFVDIRLGWLARNN